VLSFFKYTCPHHRQQAESFPLGTESDPGSYTFSSIQTAFAAIKSRWPACPLRVALFNVGCWVRSPFLDFKPEQLQESIDIHIVAAFAFAREAILAFKELDIDEEGGKGKRGTLIFTGATASTRGGPLSSVFSASMFGSRALSQSLAKEFGKENIHVSSTLIHIVFFRMINLLFDSGRSCKPVAYAPCHALL
jgi:NAD(P)-dependent dehydrogenase (short-subunit alcohol dehydrogenase family)